MNTIVRTAIVFAAALLGHHVARADDALFQSVLSVNEERAFLTPEQSAKVADARKQPRTKAAAVVNVNKGALLGNTLSIASLDGKVLTFRKAPDTSIAGNGVFVFHGVSDSGGDAHIAMGPDGDIIGTIYERDVYLVLTSIGLESGFQTLVSVRQGAMRIPEVTK